MNKNAFFAFCLKKTKVNFKLKFYPKFTFIFSNWKKFGYLRNLKILDSTIYKKFSGIFYDFIMVSVVELGKLNKDAAVQIFENSIKQNWNSTGYYGFNNFKVCIIKFLGLRFFLFGINFFMKK